MMKTKLGQAFKVLSVSLLLGLSAGVFYSQHASAAIPVDCPDGTTQNAPTPAAVADACDGHQATRPNSTKVVQPLKDDCRVTEDEKAKGVQLDKNNCGIIRMVITLTNVLSAIVGIIIVLAITVAGIQYSMAGGDPQKVTAAKHRIRSAMLALALYIFMFAFLQWIVPGGVF